MLCPACSGQVTVVGVGGAESQHLCQMSSGLGHPQVPGILLFIVVPGLESGSSIPSCICAESLGQVLWSLSWSGWAHACKPPTLASLGAGQKMAS